uniref:LITAF domain-containing protein n=1 Tax=Pectinophora gossypiella TaxID=13191 RepID=A0A1E1W1R8_PECGO
MSLGAQTLETPYQGYPYVCPRVTEAPSLTPEQVAALAKWQNLPRRQAGVAKTEGSGRPVRLVSDAVPSPSSSGSKQESEDTPVIYVEVPDASGTSQTVGQAGRPGQASSSKPAASGFKQDTDPEPVIYIDIPDSNGSGVSQTREEDGEPAYVQETIFYDPFKDRRINLPRDSDSEGEASTHRSPRPPVPTTLNLASPGSSGYSSFTATSSIPPYLNKETYIYGRQPTPDDGFPLSPIPVSDFPAPPPSYQEVEQQTAAATTTEPVDPPRTQVITPSSPTITLDGSRKLITCQHCNMTVPTLVIMESGFLTHLLAFFIFLIVLLVSESIGVDTLLFFVESLTPRLVRSVIDLITHTRKRRLLTYIFPLAILVYCFDCCKYKNHYCPSCNKRVGYESPLICGSEMSYVS